MAPTIARATSTAKDASNTNSSLLMPSTLAKVQKMHQKRERIVWKAKKVMRSTSKWNDTLGGEDLLKLIAARSLITKNAVLLKENAEKRIAAKKIADAKAAAKKAAAQKERDSYDSKVAAMRRAYERCPYYVYSDDESDDEPF